MVCPLLDSPEVIHASCYPRCGGRGVHQKTVVACRLIVDANGKRHKETRTFGTMTQELLTLGDWLVMAECTHLTMESIGV